MKITNNKTIILDIESNGFEGSSVLSICAFRGDEKFERYYHSVEEENTRATAFNGLTPDVIDSKRAEATYAKHFIEDKDFIEFCRDAEILVAHNLKFDYSFMPKEIKEMKLKLFCTMKALTNQFRKNMSLKDTAEHFNIPFDEKAAHGAVYDASICREIYNAIPEDLKIFREEYLTKIYAGKNEKGQFLIPFSEYIKNSEGQRIKIEMSGKTADELSKEEIEIFLSKYTSETHQMFDDVLEASKK